MQNSIKKIIITSICLFALGVSFYIGYLIQPYIENCIEAEMVVGIIFAIFIIWLTIKWCQITNKINGYEP